MRHRYDLAVTRYICDREKCQTPFDIPSDALYEFAGADDSFFWCAACECEPHARLLGTPAHELPDTLQLPQQFSIRPVPRLDPSDDVELGNLMYRPYSQRSFLRQYLEWLVFCGVDTACEFQPTATCFKKFDAETQRYTDEIDYELVDDCNGSSTCQFLRTETVKPLCENEIVCASIKLLCTKQPPYGLCQTNDEANILRNYLLISGGDHFPMLIPQPSILSGAKRPDFLCFIPITKFQFQTVVVLVDRPGKPERQINNENAIYDNHGYHVRRILVDWDSGFSYFKAARDLKNWVESQ